MPTIKELAKSVGFKGPASHRIAEPSKVNTLPVIDNSVPGQATIRTSIDCYVSGQYVAEKGKITEVTQRYTIFVAYSKSTQMQTMDEVRHRIIADFEAKYGKTFNIVNVHVPGLPVPKHQLPRDVGEIEFYHGSRMFRSMTRYERMLYDVRTQRDIARTNIESIKKRYGMR